MLILDNEGPARRVQVLPRLEPRLQRFPQWHTTYVSVTEGKVQTLLSLLQPCLASAHGPMQLCTLESVRDNNPNIITAALI